MTASPRTRPVDVGLRYEDGRLAEVVASREGAFGWRLTAEGGDVREERLVPALLDAQGRVPKAG